MGNTVHLSAIRCFPFLAVKHSPSYRQRKRSLDFARDDDTRNALFPHILCMMHDSHPPRCHFERSEKSFPSLFSLTPSLSRLRETPSTFLRYGVSHFSFSNTRRLTANEKDPSTSLPMTIRETRLFHFPRYGVSRSSLSNTLRLTVNEKDPSTSLGMTIRETRLFHFPRYGVSHFSPSDALRLTANEKDPSTSLPMTIRETCFSHTFFV